MKEVKVEDYLDERVDARGGFTIKLSPRGYKGIPDRLVVLPGRIFFVELKRPRGGRLAKLQAWWKQRIEHRGHKSYVCINFAEVDAVLDEQVPDM
jgi:hypothetical protein